MANTSSLPAASVTALVDRMVPAGDRLAQPPGLRLLYSHSELSVSTAKTTALPDRFVAALSCWNEPGERKAQPAGVCSQRWWSEVTAKTSAWPAPSVTELIDRMVPAGESRCQRWRPIFPEGIVG